MKDFVQRIAAPLFGISLLIGVHQADAAQTKTVSYSTSLPSTKTDIDTTLQLQKFDISLGTLQSISIKLDVGFTTTVTVTNAASSVSNGTVSTKVMYYLNDPGQYLLVSKGSNPTPNNPYGIYTETTKAISDDQYYSLGVGQSDTLDSQTTSASSTKSYTSGFILGEFSGAANSTISLTIQTFTSTVQSNSGGNTGADQVTNTDAQATVTYTYIEAPQNIPEPSTWAMLIGGLGVLTFTQRMGNKRF